MTPFRALLRHEVRMLVRDRRMLFLALILPVIAIPGLLLVLRTVDRGESRRIEASVYRYAVVGTDAERARAWVLGALGQVADRDAAPRGEAGEEPPPSFSAVEVAAGEALEPALSGLREGDVHLVVESVAGSEVGHDDPTLRIHFRAENDFSRTAAVRLEDGLDRIRQAARDSVYVAAGLPVAPDRIIPLEVRDVGGAERQGTAVLALALTPFVLLLMLTGGSIAAVDTLSGERERGTLETLLTTAVSREDVVRAKLAAIVLFGLAVVGVNAATLGAALQLGFFDLPGGLVLAPSLPGLAAAAVLLIPIAVLVAAALLSLSGHVDGYRDFQIAFFPLLLVFVALAVAGMLPGMTLRSAAALLPVGGVGLAVREVLAGRYDGLFLLIAWAATAFPAWLLIRHTERALSTERLVAGRSAEGRDRGPAAFPGHVAGWFAVLWAIFFLNALWFGEVLGVRGQVAVNLVVLFGGGSWLMIRRYRLDPLRVLALRAPHPAAWVAVLVGAPAGALTALGLARLVDRYVFPVPLEQITALGDALALDALPLWQILLFLAVLPGVLEEIAFRGLLLHGLSTRLRPVALCLVTGLVFGVFHVALFRVVPTAYLGALLAGTVLLTGSIFPAMLWHTLNNAGLLLATRAGWFPEDGQLPAPVYVVSALALAGAFILLWRTRSTEHLAAPNRMRLSSASASESGARRDA